LTSRHLDLDIAHPDGDDLATLDAGEPVTELALVTGTTGDLNEGREANTAQAIAALARVPRPALRSLEIVERYVGLDLAARTDGWLEKAPRDCTHANANDALWAQVPNLEQLSAGGFGIFHRLDAPSLRSLHIDDVPFCDRGEWHAPELVSIDWGSYWITSGYSSDCDLSHLEVLWERELPALSELTLRGSFVQMDAAIELYEVRDFVARLRSLCVPVTFITGYDRRRDLVRVLLENAAHLSHLSKLIVTSADDEHDPDELEELHAALPNVVLDPRCNIHSTIQSPKPGL
jgi:hypothetical protein